MKKKNVFQYLIALLRVLNRFDTVKSASIPEVGKFNAKLPGRSMRSWIAAFF